VRLSDLQSKNIVNISDGKNIGNIIDVNIGIDGVVESLIVEANRNIFSLNRENDSEIMWKDINKIGEDVILVNSKL